MVSGQYGVDFRFAFLNSFAGLAMLKLILVPSDLHEDVDAGASKEPHPSAPSQITNPAFFQSPQQSGRVGKVEVDEGKHGNEVGRDLFRMRPEGA